MQISKISNTQSFKGLEIHNDAYRVLRPQSVSFIRDIHETKLFKKKMKACKNNEYADVIVKEDASVFLKDKKTGKSTRIFSVYKPDIAFCNFYIALSKAAMLDECYRKGLNPYDYMD